MAPSATERWAARRFFTPRRLRRPAPPEVPGLARRAWSLAAAGQRLAGWSWGEGRPVLLVHGWEGQAAQLAAFVPPLVAAGLRAVAFDMPAHGASTGRRATALDFAASIRAVAELTGPPAGVVAHSLGGAATVYALRQGLRAERVVLLAPGAEPLEFAWIMAHALGFRGAAAARVVEGIRGEIGGAWEDWSVPRLARDLDLPALVLHDAADREVPFEHGRRLAAAWPGARCVRLDGLGHRRLLRDPGVIAEAVGFLAARDCALAA
ncbi:MAG TPA: alpha/beta fold hydrolase [Thermoanaerobaculia bacterium]|nr:alpha/beta fold hydrolase [Thermoanaerobaculia bacterium]